MHWLAWALLGFRFQETAMLGRGIANASLTKSCQSVLGKAVLAVAAVIHAASDQALRQPEQADESGGDDQQSHG